ncbi:hypothetical protein DMENIID0001_143790 [Sergentomyia squamirostris]
MKEFLESFKVLNFILLFTSICPFLTVSIGGKLVISQRKLHYWVIFSLNFLMTIFECLCGLIGYLLDPDIWVNWDLQHTLVMISFTVPQIIYQVNILSIFAKGEQHANVFRQIVKFEETFRDVFKTPVDFTSWTFWTYVDYIIAAVYWLVVYILKTQYYQFENFLVFIYHLTLALLDLNSLFIVCHIRSTVRCLRTFQEYLLTISREIQEEAESHSGSELRNLHIQSRQLKNLKRKINETFGPLLLVSIVYDFVVLVFQLYFYLRYIFRYHALSQVGQIIKILGFVCKASVYVTEMEEYYQEV